MRAARDTQRQTMNRRDFIKAMVGTSTMAIGGCFPTSAKQRCENGTRKPNVVLILTDDQGFGDVGFNGNPFVKTPNIDGFAARSVVFEQFYVCPVCSPTRASLLTGRYHFRTGVLETQAGMSMLRPCELTIAEALKADGYRCGMFGKWHLGDNCPTRPIDQGFDCSLTHIGGMIGAPYNPLDANSYFEPVLLENGREKKYAGYCADIFTDAAIDFVEANRNEPFFLYLAPNTPHHPLTVPQKYSMPYLDMGLSEETSRFYGMITNIDDNFKKLTDKLENLGLLDNTVVIFSGDNGTSSLHKQSDLWDCGLRGRKTFVYENGIRVPMFINVPGCAGGRKIEHCASAIDIMPTILDTCGVRAGDAKFDGISLVPLLRGDAQKLPDRNLYIQWHRGDKPVKYKNFAVRGGGYKLVLPLSKYEQFITSQSGFELYDIWQDPFEKNDIAAQYPQIVDSLKKDYEKWFDEVTQGQDYSPTKIYIGSESENPVLLTRQDWQGGGIFDGENGYYDLDVRTEADYRITCRLTDLLSENHTATLTIGGMVLHKDILYAESQCRFDKIHLPKGQTRLEAYIETQGRKCGFRFIEIERLN